MLKKRAMLTLGLIIAIVIFYALLQFYKTYIPSGILWSNGVSRSEVKLVLEENSQFHHYLYEKNTKLKGVVTLQKRGKSKFWSLYHHEAGAYPQAGFSDVELVKTYYGTYTNGKPALIPVWGGFLAIDEGNSFSIRSKNQEYSPNLMTRVDGKIYFFFSSLDITDRDSIEVIKR